MAKGESGRVIGGPERVDGFIWWALKLKNGDTGWATEKKVLASTESTGDPVQMLAVVRKSDRLPGQSTSKEEKKTGSRLALFENPPIDSGARKKTRYRPKASTNKNPAILFGSIL